MGKCKQILADWEIKWRAKIGSLVFCFFSEKIRFFAAKVQKSQKTFTQTRTIFIYARFTTSILQFYINCDPFVRYQWNFLSITCFHENDLLFVFVQLRFCQLYCHVHFVHALLPCTFCTRLVATYVITFCNAAGPYCNLKNISSKFMSCAAAKMTTAMEKK